MKNALSRTLRDQNLAGADVIPTSTMELPESEPIQPTQDLIADALRHRAELVESRIQLKQPEISNKAVRNALLPTLDLFAYYGGAGLGGSQNPSNLCVNQAAGRAGRGFLRRTQSSLNSSWPDLHPHRSHHKLRRHAQPAHQLHRVRQRRRRDPEHSAAQPCRPGSADPLGTGIPAGPDALAANRKPDQHRSPQRPVRSRTEPRQRSFSSGCRGLCQAVAGRRTEEISVRHLDHNVGPADRRAGWPRRSPP